MRVCVFVTLCASCHSDKNGCLCRPRHLNSLKLLDVNPAAMDFYDEDDDLPLRVEGWLNVWGKFSLISSSSALAAHSVVCSIRDGEPSCHWDLRLV